MTPVLKNLELVDPRDALVSLDDIDVAYGYGVYETLKVRKGVLYYPAFHEARLFESARIIGIAHTLECGDLAEALVRLVRAAAPAGGDCNLKVLLIGHTGHPADLYAFVLNPLFPDRKDLKHGGRALVFEGERHFPAAKSLSMLLSTIAFRRAREENCYDALLLNSRGELTEGTRTNLFYWFPSEPDSGGGIPKTIYTPPLSQVLNGVTRRTVIDCLVSHGIRIEEAPFPADSIPAPGTEPGSRGLPALFLTSTSTKIMPIRTVLLPGMRETGSGARADAGGAGKRAGAANETGAVSPEADAGEAGNAGEADAGPRAALSHVELPVPEAFRIFRAWYDEYLSGWAADQERII